MQFHPREPAPLVVEDNVLDRDPVAAVLRACRRRCRAYSLDARAVRQRTRRGVSRFSLSVGGCRIHKSYLTRNWANNLCGHGTRSQLSGPIRSGGDESEFPRVGKYDDTHCSTDWLAFLITFPKCFAAEAFTAKPAMHVLLPLMAIVNVKTAAQAKVIGGWP